jgi:hypothetical protein
MLESHSHGNLDPLDGLHALEIRRQQQEIMAAVATLVPPPLKSIVVNPVPCHSAVGFSKKNSQKKEKIPQKGQH